MNPSLFPEAEAGYAQTLEYLFSRLPLFSRIGAAALKKDLHNIRALCEALDNPQQRFKSVHIAGTNGKGSTSHGLAAVLQACGYRTGLYTSPHLVDFRERIHINGTPVPKAFVVNFTERVRPLIERIQPSFFEITVAMAFQYFAEAGVDMAVIETGLGGRLDSTNIITPELSIITNIALDHTDLLGDTLPLIAREKAGIAKPGVPLLIGEEGNEDVERVFFEAAVHKGNPLHHAEGLWDLVKVGSDVRRVHYKAVRSALNEVYDLSTDLTGSYQARNLKTVLAAAEILTGKGWNLPLERVLAALSDVKGHTGLRGRWDVWQETPLVVADVAHNPAGLREILQQWAQVDASEKHIVLGFVRDKDVSEALALFPKDAQYHFCNAAIPRALPAEELRMLASAAGLNGTVHNSVKAATEAASTALPGSGAMLVTGSFFVVGEAMAARPEWLRD